MTEEAARSATLRLALLTGIHSALLRHQEVLAAISASTDRSAAHSAIRSLLHLDQTQADAVLDLGWARLTKAAVDEVHDEIVRINDFLEGPAGSAPC